MTNMQLYNMDSDKQWRGKFNKGDSWRGDTIYECILCFSRTNKWIMSGGCSYGPIIFCPAERNVFHGELLHTLKQHTESNEKIKEYKEIINYATGIDQTSVQRMMENLHIEKNLLEFKIRKLRDELSGKYNDIQGIIYSGRMRPLYPSRFYFRPNREFGKDESIAEWLYRDEEQKRFFDGF